MPTTKKTTKAVREAPLGPDEQQATIAALDYHIARLENIGGDHLLGLREGRLDACKRAKEKILNA